MVESKPNDKPYLHIRAWGELLRSSSYYVRDEVEKARRDDAPDDAIYEHQGRWFTIHDITSPVTRSRIAALVEELKGTAL
jgi:hypothetical protein